MRRSVCKPGARRCRDSRNIKQEVVCGKSHRVLHTQQSPQTDKADPRGTTRSSDRVRLIEKEIGLSTMCFKNKIFERRRIKMKTTNENTQFNHNLKPARLAFLAALMLITFVAAVIPAAAQESPRSLKSAQTAEAVTAKGSRDVLSPALAAAYCTYTINGTYNLFCNWSRINANSHVVAAISEY